MKKLGLVFVLGLFLFSCKGTSSIENGGSIKEKTHLIHFASDDENVAVVEVHTESGEQVKNGERLKNGTKIIVTAVFKDYEWEITHWEVNSSNAYQKLRSFSYTVVQDVNILLKLNKLVFDETKPNIVFKIPEIDGKDEVDLILHLAGKKAGDVIQIDFGDGKKIDYTFESTEPSKVSKRIDIPCEVKIYGKLQHFNAIGNKYISEISFYNCNNLKVCRLSQNKIDRLDLSTIPACKELHITDNKITEIDLTSCRELEELYCGYNEIEKLDVRENKSLTVLNCYNTHIKELDISNNPLLEILKAGDNEYSKEIVFDFNPLLKSIDLENIKLPSINLSNLKKLEKLWLKGNRLVSIKLKDNTLLNYLDLGENNIETLDVSMLPLLEELRCNKNKLKSLDLSENKKLKIINLKNNDFSACSLNQLFLSVNPPLEVNNGFAIGENPGATTSNTKIAKDKGWRLDVEGDGSAVCQ